MQASSKEAGVKAKVVKAWACGFCAKTYPHNEHGKMFAADCCLCRQCGKNPSAYTGRTTYCKECHARAELKSAEEGLAHAEARLKHARSMV